MHCTSLLVVIHCSTLTVVVLLSSAEGPPDTFSLEFDVHDLFFPAHFVEGFTISPPQGEKLLTDAAAVNDVLDFLFKNHSDSSTKLRLNMLLGYPATPSFHISLPSLQKLHFQSEPGE
jgi:hypothetical protein